MRLIVDARSRGMGLFETLDIRRERHPVLCRARPYVPFQFHLLNLAKRDDYRKRCSSAPLTEGAVALGRQQRLPAHSITHRPAQTAVLVNS